MKRIGWLVYTLFSFWMTPSAFSAFGEGFEAVQAEQLPTFTFADPEGAPVTLEHYKGKIIVLNIWSLTCGPCVAEMPTLDQLAGYYSEDKDLVVITLNIDPVQKAGIQAFYNENRYQYLKIYQDPGRASKEALKWQGLPTTLIFDREGRLLFRKIGFEKWNTPEALDFFDQLIQGKTPKLKESFLGGLKKLFRL